jgi:hypothetical protein
MLVSVSCQKCGETFSLDVGEATQVEVEKTMRERKGFECPGHHVELASPLDYWTIDWSTLREGGAPSEEEWLADLKSRYAEVYDTQELYDTPYEITSFCYGIPCAKHKETGESVSMDFTSSPKGKRYYYILGGAK